MALETRRMGEDSTSVRRDHATKYQESDSRLPKQPAPMAAITAWGLGVRGTTGKRALPERCFGKSVSMEKVWGIACQKLF